MMSASRPRAGEILCIAGIDGNGQSELIYGLTGLEKCSGGTVTLCGHDISHASIHHRSADMSHIPEDRHKHGLVLDLPWNKTWCSSASGSHGSSTWALSSRARCAPTRKS